MRPIRRVLHAAASTARWRAVVCSTPVRPRSLGARLRAPTRTGPPKSSSGPHGAHCPCCAPATRPTRQPPCSRLRATTLHSGRSLRAACHLSALHLARAFAAAPRARLAAAARAAPTQSQRTLSPSRTTRSATTPPPPPALRLGNLRPMRVSFSSSLTAWSACRPTRRWTVIGERSACCSMSHTGFPTSLAPSRRTSVGGICYTRTVWMRAPVLTARNRTTTCRCRRHARHPFRSCRPPPCL